MAHIKGSWFNTGYHGHFRSKSRSDFVCEYRYLAQPQPPETFKSRSKKPATHHIFSHHDNKHSFINDALYFEEGLGRRRIKNNTNRLDPDLLVWMPQRREIDRSGPKTSCYKLDYGRSLHFAPKQQLVQRPKTSFDDDYVATTTYRYAHGMGNPNRPSMDIMKNVAMTTVPNRRQKASLGATQDTVASCLNWHVVRPRTSIPMSTQTTDFDSQSMNVEIKQICPKTAPTTCPSATESLSLLSTVMSAV